MEVHCDIKIQQTDIDWVHTIQHLLYTYIEGILPAQ